MQWHVRQMPVASSSSFFAFKIWAKNLNIRVFLLHINTKKIQTQTKNPNIVMSVMGFGIVIRGESGWIIRIEATPYLGKLYTYVEFTSPDDKNDEENYFSAIRAIVPPWVWRKVKKMISNGVDVKQIESFVFNAVKEFVPINITDKFITTSRIYYEEPYRLLSSFFSPQPPEEQKPLFSNPPRVFKCACAYKP